MFHLHRVSNEAGFVWRKLELCVAGAPPNLTSLAGHGMQACEVSSSLYVVSSNFFIM